MDKEEKERGDVVGGGDVRCEVNRPSFWAASMPKTVRWRRLWNSGICEHSQRPPMKPSPRLSFSVSISSKLPIQDLGPACKQA